MDSGVFNKKESESPVDQDYESGSVEPEVSSGELATIHIPGIDTVFEEQAALVNHAVQVIGMGKYQWALFVLAGYGWMCDQLWQTTVSDALAQVAVEFQPKHSAFLSLALIAGLVCGAGFWGLGSDLIGRRVAFNLTLFIAGVFGLAAGAAPNFVACATLCAFIGFGVGGNLPVDSAIFLEFLPATHQYLLVILSVWWALGQIIPAGAAWGFLPNYSCSATSPPEQCHKADNMGWRYLLYSMGALTLVLWAGRFLFFHLHESPKYLIGQGRYIEAIEVLNAVAKYNGTTQPLTVVMLEKVEIDHAERHGQTSEVAPVDRKTAIKRTFAAFKPGGFPHVRALLSTFKLAYSFTLILLIWGMIGLASPLYSNFLPEYLAAHGAKTGDGSINVTYRNNFIIILCSLPGTLLGGWLVGIKYVGRRGTLGGSLIITSIFLFAFTTAKNSAENLAFNCVSTFVQYIMWGALYCYTPEVFPSIHRGTGTGLASAFNRICGLMAPIIATYVGYTDVPIFVSAALYLVAGILSFCLPFETMGKASI